MASTSIDSHKVWPLPLRHDWSCWSIAFPSHPRAKPRSIPFPPTGSWRSCPEKKSARCDLLHTELYWPVLNLRHGPENPPSSVRAEHGHPRRLRPHRRRRRSGTFRVDLSHPDLTGAKGTACDLQARPLRIESARGGKGSAHGKKHLKREGAPKPVGFFSKISQAPSNASTGIPKSHCVNRA